jgi:hypothetical protein
MIVISNILYGRGDMKKVSEYLNDANTIPSHIPNARPLSALGI